MPKQSYRQNVRERITNGRYSEYKGLSICMLNDFYEPMNKKIKYQVHCRSFSGLYEDIEEALNKFFELRRKMR